MEYEKEIEQIQNNSGEVFKPSIGVHEIEITTEPEATEYVDMEGNKTPQIKLVVKVTDEEKTWYVSKGMTFKSLYGQLMALGKIKGKLEGEKITLSVTTSKNRKGETINSYSILEAVKILPLLDKPKVEQI